MIVAIKALTRAFSAVARSANTHPRVVMLALVAIAVSIIVIAVLGAYSLLIQPSMPKIFFAAAVAGAAWVTGAASAIAIPIVSFRPAQLLSHH